MKVESATGGNRSYSHMIATIALCMVIISAIIGGCSGTRPHVVDVVPDRSPSVSSVSSTAIRIMFDQPMSASSVENAFSISPSDGKENFGFEWTGDRSVTVKFSKPLAPNTTYTITIGTSARGTNNIEMSEPYILTFTTSAANAESQP
ncbi:MAG: Ig-like domain-containing protein [Armatimonadota bacterium]